MLSWKKIFINLQGHNQVKHWEHTVLNFTKTGNPVRKSEKETWKRESKEKPNRLLIVCDRFRSSFSREILCSIRMFRPDRIAVCVFSTFQKQHRLRSMKNIVEKIIHNLLTKSSVVFVTRIRIKLQSCQCQCNMVKFESQHTIYGWRNWWKV